MYSRCAESTIILPRSSTLGGEPCPPSAARLPPRRPPSTSEDGARRAGPGGVAAAAMNASTPVDNEASGATQPLPPAQEWQRARSPDHSEWAGMGNVAWR